MRDALYTVCSNISPLISEVLPSNIQIEKPHLLAQAPKMRPGDVVIDRPIDIATEPHKSTLIDLTMIPPYKAPPECTTFPAITKGMATHHRLSEYKKFKLKDSESSHATADQLAQEMIAKRYRLLPFTVDHQGMLGPIASEFLLGNDKSFFSSNIQEYETRQTSVPISKLIQFSQHKKRKKNVLKRATKHWRETFGNKWYTNTFHAQTPGQWAKQVMGITFSMESAKHILRATNLAYSKSLHATPKQRKISCCSMNLHTPSSYTVRSLQQAMLPVTNRA